MPSPLYPPSCLPQCYTRSPCPMRACLLSCRELTRLCRYADLDVEDRRLGPSTRLFQYGHPQAPIDALWARCHGTGTSGLAFPSKAALSAFLELILDLSRAEYQLFLSSTPLLARIGASERLLSQLGRPTHGHRSSSCTSLRSVSRFWHRPARHRTDALHRSKCSSRSEAYLVPLSTSIEKGLS